MFPCSSHIRLLHQRFFSYSTIIDILLWHKACVAYFPTVSNVVVKALCTQKSRHCYCEQMRRDFNSNDTWNSNTEILSLIMHRGIRTKKNRTTTTIARQFIAWKLLWFVNVNRSMMIALVNCISTSLYRSFVQFFNINAIIVTKRVRNTHTICRARDGN